MNANDYQEQAARTLISNADAPILVGEPVRLLWNALGLAGEAGEVADLIKKGVLHEHGLDDDRLVKELGDVCWYVAALCTVIGVPFSLVLEQNIAKLKARYPAGWDPAKSQQRDEAAEQLALLPPTPRAAQLALPAEQWDE